MTYNRQIIAQIDRLGEVADVLVHDQQDENAFGNPESDWTPDRTVIAFRTYPNRNTEVNNRDGDWHRDNPVFLIPKDDNDENNDNEPPGDEDRLRYPSEDGNIYEMKARTEYKTHVEMFGEIVLNHPENE